MKRESSITQNAHFVASLIM